MSGLLGKIKQGIQKSGTSKSKVLFVKADSKVRVRFLKDVDDGTPVTVHDSFDQGINALCLEHIGQDCPYCGDESLRTREAYVWPVWDHDSKEVKLFMGYANNFNPLPSFIAMYESYGTLLDRDYVINRTGKQQSTSYSVVPMDKVRFKNAKAKPLSEKETIKILAEAFPVNEEDAPKGKSKSKNRKSQDEDDDEDDNESDYDSMSPAELYKECISRGIEAERKKKAAYYIQLLEDDDDAEDDEWDEDSEDDEDDYESMSPAELYKECIERGINAKKKKTKDYYIELLEADDEEADDEEEEDEDEW